MSRSRSWSRPTFDLDDGETDGIVQDFSHLPLAREEKIRVRETELEHISAQTELGT